MAWVNDTKVWRMNLRMMLRGENPKKNWRMLGISLG
jgi:hypothetical protein